MMQDNIGMDWIICESNTFYLQITRVLSLPDHNNAIKKSFKDL